MRKIADPSRESFDISVCDLLCTVSATHVSVAPAEALECNRGPDRVPGTLHGVLLQQISGIQTRLARDLKHTGLT
jgi:hypothetical protein